jgi:hypothetical protein
VHTRDGASRRQAQKQPRGPVRHVGEEPVDPAGLTARREAGNTLLRGSGADSTYCGANPWEPYLQRPEGLPRGRRVSTLKSSPLDLFIYPPTVARGAGGLQRFGPQRFATLTRLCMKNAKNARGAYKKLTDSTAHPRDLVRLLFDGQRLAALPARCEAVVRPGGWWGGGRGAVSGTTSGARPREASLSRGLRGPHSPTGGDGRGMSRPGNNAGPFQGGFGTGFRRGGARTKISVLLVYL